jgi:hypothetical protein
MEGGGKHKHLGNCHRSASTAFHIRDYRALDRHSQFRAPVRQLLCAQALRLPVPPDFRSY